MTIKLLLVVNVDWFFFSHRLPVALGALRKGYEVHVATTISNDSYRDLFNHHGLILHELKIDRSAKSISSYLVNLWLLFTLFRRLRPHLLHLVTIQPVLLGGIAARLANVKNIIYAISGLGHVFIGSSFLTRIRLLAVKVLYKVALGSSKRAVIFQNPDDLARLSRICSISPKESYLIPGSGVDLSLYIHEPPQNVAPVVLMASRLLFTKGVREFIAAAKILRDRGANSRFLLVGAPDLSNPASITLHELKRWESTGDVEILGYRTDVDELISAADIVCLPSYYPEGLPKILCEAAASGRAVVTTDEPGCRDAILNGVTGLLVPSRDSLALANALDYLFSNPHLIRSMGHAARVRAEKLFDVNAIVDQHLNVYDSLLSSSYTSF